MRTYKLYLLRHGLTRANLEGRYIGSTDYALCEKGEAALAELLDRCEYPNVSRVYSSPLLRCTQTARLLYPELSPVVVEALRECDFGEFENKTAYELAGAESYHKWILSGREYTPKGGEAAPDFLQRVMSGFDVVIQNMMRDKLSDAAVVTHGGVIAAFLSQCGLPKRSLAAWGVEPGRGYTLLVNASLWANARLAEVFTPLPYGPDTADGEAGGPNEFYAGTARAEGKGCQ